MPAIRFNELPAQEAFEQLLPEARALQPELVQPYRGDALLAYHNAKSGAANVLEREEDIKNLPGIDVSVIKNVPNIAMAVKFAADRVNRLPEASDISELEPRVLELRRRMLHAAVSLADSDLLPKREVDNIQAGRGKINHASDAVQLAALFRKHANDIAGKHPISQDDIDQAAELGSRLLSLLKPSTTPRNAERSPLEREAVDLRDRMWTLLIQAYEMHLWRAGAMVFGRQVDELVPALLSRRVDSGDPQEPEGPLPPEPEDPVVPVVS